MSYGGKWKQRRIAPTPAFHSSILNEFVDIYKKYAQKLVSRILARTKGEMAIDVQNILNLAMLDVIFETSMGLSVNALESDAPGETE